MEMHIPTEMGTYDASASIKNILLTYDSSAVVLNKIVDSQIYMEFTRGLLGQSGTMCAGLSSP